MSPTEKTGRWLVPAGIAGQFPQNTLWRSLKSILFGLLPPQFQSEDRGLVVNRALAYYSNRPHEGLGGATPIEIYLGLEPTHLRAVQFPRGKLGAPCASHNIEVAYLDGDRRFPYLKHAA